MRSRSYDVSGPCMATSPRTRYDVDVRLTSATAPKLTLRRPLLTALVTPSGSTDVVYEPAVNRREERQLVGDVLCKLGLSDRLWMGLCDRRVQRVATKQVSTGVVLRVRRWHALAGRRRDGDPGEIAGEPV